MFGAMLVFGVLVRSRTQVRSLSRCASVGALHASAVLCVGGLPPSDYGIHATSTTTLIIIAAVNYNQLCRQLLHFKTDTNGRLTP